MAGPRFKKKAREARGAELENTLVDQRLLRQLSTKLTGLKDRALRAEGSSLLDEGNYIRTHLNKDVIRHFLAALKETNEVSRGSVTGGAFECVASCCVRALSSHACVSFFLFWNHHLEER